MRKITILAAAIMVTVTPAVAGAQKPKVTEAQARATALSLVKDGKIRSGELEREHGKLIYSFDIAQPNKAGVEEVQISAITGKLVARHHESSAKEAAEAKAEAKEAKQVKP